MEAREGAGTLGQRIRAFRKELNLTQQELADAASIDRTTISRLENNALRELRSDAVGRLAEAMGLPVESLLGIDQESDVVILNRSTSRIIQIACKVLPEARKKELENFALFLLKQEGKESYATQDGEKRPTDEGFEDIPVIPPKADG